MSSAGVSCCSDWLIGKGGRKTPGTGYFPCKRGLQYRVLQALVCCERAYSNAKLSTGRRVKVPLGLVIDVACPLARGNM